jgi:hypothetical protein
MMELDQSLIRSFAGLAFLALMAFSVFVKIWMGNSHRLSPSKNKAAKMSNYTDQIYNQLISGSPNNPGIPQTLAQIVTAQSQHESANYSSNVFTNAKNAFGYKYYAGSPYQSGNFEGYAMYSSINDSVNEIIDYLYRRQADGSFPDLSTITTPDQYANLLKNAGPGAYFEDTVLNYASGIAKYLATDVFQPITNLASSAASGNLTSIAILAGAGLGIYFLLK